jgi:hypothetical protein
VDADETVWIPVDELTKDPPKKTQEGARLDRIKQTKARYVRGITSKVTIERKRVGRKEWKIAKAHINDKTTLWVSVYADDDVDVGKCC